MLEDTIVLGEVNLDGSVLPIHGLLPIMLHAEERGVRKMIVPHRNLDEASMVDGLDVVGVRHVGELIELMGGDATYTIPDTPVTDETTTDQSPTSHPNDCGDMNEVLGQEHAKWALQVAAAGGHNLIMTGPPGSGKTMLASRMPGIMCPLNEAEQLEVASIRSLCGILPQYGITDMPPFEAPHHTASTAALVGGGSGIAVPGRNHARASRHSVSGRGTGIQRTRPADAARTIGIRVCGAFPFKRQHLLPGLIPTHHGGQPLSVRILLRHRRTLRLPGKDRIRYFSRLSGPILDRVDIQMAVPPVSRIAVQSEPIGESSAGIQARVIRARQVAKDRFRQYGWVCNAQASGKWLHANTSLKAMELVNRALSNHQLTLRGADRAMRLSWTLADLAGRVSPTEQDVHQGIEMRTRMT